MTTEKSLTESAGHRKFSIDQIDCKLHHFFGAIPVAAGVRSAPKPDDECPRKMSGSHPGMVSKSGFQTLGKTGSQKCDLEMTTSDQISISTCRMTGGHRSSGCSSKLPQA